MEERFEKKHFILTQMDPDQDRGDTRAVYQGEFHLGEFPARVAYWKDGYLMVPSWFGSKDKAMAYIKDVENNTPAEYYMVQERHYVKSDTRIAHAEIIGCLGGPFGMYPHPSRGETQKRAGEPMIDVWTMYFRSRELATQYVNAFNADVESARGGEEKIG